VLPGLESVLKVIIGKLQSVSEAFASNKKLVPGVKPRKRGSRSSQAE
jgi:hypothetical protein